MIAIEALNIGALPSLPLSERLQLPPIAAIYFAVDSEGVLCYIGQSANLKNRCHRSYHPALDKIVSGKIHWLEEIDKQEREKLELQLIRTLKPRFNLMGIPEREFLVRTGRLTRQEWFELEVSA